MYTLRGTRNVSLVLRRVLQGTFEIIWNIVIIFDLSYNNATNSFHQKSGTV